MNLYRLPTIVLFCACSTVDLVAQETLAIRQAIALGLENNYAIRIAKNEAEIASNDVTLGNAGFLPTINLNSGFTGSSNNTRQEYVSGQRIERTGARTDAFTSSLTLNWTIFDGFNMFVASEKLQKLREVGELNREMAVETTVAQILQAYFDVVRKQQLLEVARRGVSISEERVKVAEDKYNVGSGSRLELLQAKVDLNADRSALLRQEVSLSNSKITLNQLLARESNIDFAATDTIKVIPNLAYDELKRRALESNSALQMANYQKNLAMLNRREVNAQWYPTIGVSAAYNFSRSQSQAGFVASNRNLGYNLGLTATLNLFDGFNVLRQSENARIAMMNAEVEYRDAQSRVEADLASAYKSYRNNLQLIALEQENLEVAKQNVEIALERLRIGSISPLELREAQRSFVEAESRLVGVTYEAKVAEIELLRLSAQLVDRFELEIHR